MKALVVYDSFFGNTEKIAAEIGKAMGAAKDVTVCRVTDAKSSQLEGLDILVVGSPTRAFSPTPAIKAFLKGIPAKQLEGVKVSAFDTRMVIDEKTPGILRFLVKFFGYADKPILDALKKKGGEAAVPSEGFFVTESEGPLAEGELERAGKWAGKIK